MQSWDHPLLPKDNTDSTCWQSPIIPRAQPQLAQHLPDDSCKGRKKETGIENEHVQFWPWPPIQLPTQPLTLTGSISIHEDDAKKHHEETELWWVLGPRRIMGQREGLHPAAICKKKHISQLTRLAFPRFFRYGRILPSLCFKLYVSWVRHLWFWA